MVAFQSGEASDRYDSWSTFVHHHGAVSLSNDEIWDKAELFPPKSALTDVASNACDFEDQKATKTYEGFRSPEAKRVCLL